MTSKNGDVEILRELAHQYAEIAGKPVQQERRQLWSAHNSLKPTRPPILASLGMWNVWCREIFDDHRMQCQDPFCRGYERDFRIARSVIDDMK